MRCFHLKYKYSVKELEKMRSCPYLTDKERMVLKLYYFRGWEAERVAAELDVSRGTVFNILRGLRDKAFKSE